MDMKIDSSYIKRERERRAWSQEHLAEVASLGLRTIQRIEKTGAASYESARSLAAVLGVDVANLRVEEKDANLRRFDVRSQPFLATVLAALAAGGALFYGTASFADQVLMDVSMALESGDETRAWQTQFLVDDGTLVPDVNDLRLQDLRFSIVPRVQGDDRILLEIGVFEKHGNGEVVLSRPRLIALNGEIAEVAVGAGDARTLRLTIKAQVNPPRLPPTLAAR
jgi:transcriptional regulator with XRE-family HTH domain